MVLTFGVGISYHPLKIISLSTGNLGLRGSLKHLVSSIEEVAFSYGWRLRPKSPLIQVKQLILLGSGMRMNWSVRSSADGRGVDPLTGSSDGRSRLLKTIQSVQVAISARIQDLRKDLPKKFLFFLVGFYCATAFATVIGQTGDWDILSAAVAVAIVEGIGALMYKASLPLIGKTKSIIVMFNYWKAGLTLGLFLDSFKF